MSFNKRYLSEGNLRYEYEVGGYDGLFLYVRNPDALIIEDEFSQIISDLIMKGDKDKIKVMMEPLKS